MKYFAYAMIIFLSGQLHAMDGLFEYILPLEQDSSQKSEIPIVTPDQTTDAKIQQDIQETEQILSDVDIFLISNA